MLPNCDREEHEIFNKYKRTLKDLGVDLWDEYLQETIESCAQDLETRLQAFIAWAIFLRTRGEQIDYPTIALIQAFKEEWKPVHWDDRYLATLNNKNKVVEQKIKSVQLFYSLDYDYQYDAWTNYIKFFYEGESVWCVQIEEFLLMEPGKIAKRFIEKASLDPTKCWKSTYIKSRST